MTEARSADVLVSSSLLWHMRLLCICVYHEMAIAVSMYDWKDTIYPMRKIMKPYVQGLVVEYYNTIHGAMVYNGRANVI